MKIQSWGRYPSIESDIDEPADFQSLGQILQLHDKRQTLIGRGAGRSYGDSALADHLISSRFFDNFISFNATTGVISCGAGVTLDQILRLSVPKGWFLPVLPGTKFVTIGGAIASDIHGKNHHLDGCFSSFVKSIKLMLASGETVLCNNSKRKNLYRASFGGMGLTGIVLSAKLQLMPIDSAFILQKTLVARNLDEVFLLFEENHQSRYSVAWLDCMARGKNLGRSIMLLGEHSNQDNLTLHDSFSVSAPRYSPGFLLNKHSMRVFNGSYFNLNKWGKKDKLLHYESYFFPLDRIRQWNRLYGGKGFLQYQFVIPSALAKEGIASVLNECIANGKGSFLTVLKKLGAQNDNFLSFPIEGYTLTLDFKFEQSLLPLLDTLDEIVLAHGGRVYLAKDARMGASTFKQSYPNWQKFIKVCKQVDPKGLFGSLQSQRLGLAIEKENDK